MKKFKLFCFGFGQVARYFVKNLIEKKYKFDLVVTNTTSTQTKQIGNLNYKTYFFKDDKFDNNLLKDLNSSNKVLVSIPPKNKIDIVLNLFHKSFTNNKFDWITYLSATNVYGNQKGNWVTEETIPVPTSEKGISRLNAERQWIKYYKDFKLHLQIFRLSGIYSLENNIIKRLKMGTMKIVEKHDHYFSRIHVEDIAIALTLSLKKFSKGQVFNISDNYPCPNEEIIKYVASLMNINLPKKIKQKEIENKILKSFYKDSKKVCNKKMKSFFLHKLKYPTFKEGLNAIRNNMI